MTDIAAMLASYPRKRPPLPAAQQALYVEEYKINRGTSGRRLYRLTAWLEAWMHRQVAAAPGAKLLDFGAGTLNHRSYEPAAIAYDIVEPFAELYSGQPALASIGAIYAAIEDVPQEAAYDRIVSVAVLEHLENLPAAVAGCAERLAPGGLFQAGIPAEGGLLWGLAWRATTGLSYRLRTGLPYEPVMRHEHLNRADEIVAIVRHLFREVRVRWFPLPFRHLAFYGYIEARKPDLALCARVRAQCQNS